MAKALFWTCLGFTCCLMCVFLSWEEQIIRLKQLAEKRLPYICDLVENQSRESRTWVKTAPASLNAGSDWNGGRTLE